MLFTNDSLLLLKTSPKHVFCFFPLEKKIQKNPIKMSKYEIKIDMETLLKNRDELNRICDEIDDGLKTATTASKPSEFLYLFCK